MLLRRSSLIRQHFHRSSSTSTSTSTSSTSSIYGGVAVPAEKLQLLLQRCGLNSVVDAHGGAENFARVVHSHTEYQLFAPLFTPYFTISHHQLTMLGDTTIDDFLTRAIMDYAIHVGLVLTVNATRQLKAVLHNHFTLRLFAKELRFDELSVPLEFFSNNTNNTSNININNSNTNNSEENENNENDDALAFLQPQHIGLRNSDIAGTSFQHTPLRCGQSPLGWIFSHFVGAVHRVFGRSAAEQLLLHTYGDNNNSNNNNNNSNSNLNNLNSNLPNTAAALLIRTLEHFPVANVAEAILAAQGLSHRVVAETRVLSDDVIHNNNNNNNNNNCNNSDNNKERKENDLTEAVVLWSGQNNNNININNNNTSASSSLGRSDVNIDTLAANRHIFTSLAAGPGGIDAIGTWRQRAQRQFEKLQQIKEKEINEKEKEEEQALLDINNNNSSSNNNNNNSNINNKSDTSLQDVMGKDDGWLSSSEQQQYKRGVAFSHTIHIPTTINSNSNSTNSNNSNTNNINNTNGTAAVYFADIYGIPQPINGHRVGRLKFRRNVSDRLSHINSNNNSNNNNSQSIQTRDGIPLASDGESTEMYIHRLSSGGMHSRLFDVSLEVNGRTAGRAVGTRYTIAREAACGVYITAVLQDLGSMREKHSHAEMT